MLSPCKINLGLRVFHRLRSDGRHCLATIFVPIDFGDEIAFSTASVPELVTRNLLPPHCRDDFESVSERGNREGNLLWKILTRALPAGRGLRVELTKRVPTGAGLGGGSSNAAALLSHLMSLGVLDAPAARGLAEMLGSDIAFFLEEGPQLAFGTGDRLEPIALGPGCGVLCLPPMRSATGAAYAGLKRPLQGGPAPGTWPSLNGAVRRALASSEWKEIRTLTNDFEGVVFSLEPKLAGIKAAFLEAGAPYASLSGSGSALFALTGGPVDAEKLASAMRLRFSDCSFVVFAFQGGRV